MAVQKTFTTHDLAHAIRIAASMARKVDEPNPQFVEALSIAATFFDAPPKDVERRKHPEDFCHKCGRPNVVWFAPSPLWNKSVREKGEPEILCPVCFVQLARAAGVKVAWALLPSRPNGFKATATELAEWIGPHPKWSRESVIHTIAAALSDAVALDKHST